MFPELTDDEVDAGVRRPQARLRDAAPCCADLQHPQTKSTAQRRSALSTNQPLIDSSPVGSDAVVLDEAERALFRRGRDGAIAASEDASMRRRTAGRRAARDDAPSAQRVPAARSGAGVPVVPYGAGTGTDGWRAQHAARHRARHGAPQDASTCMPATASSGPAAVRFCRTSIRNFATHGLCLGHDPWTFPVATVGGTLSTNSLGYKGGRYGGMGDQAIALEVALADGSVLRTRAVRAAQTGPDLERLFIGAEGMLGVITAAALQAHAVPERRRAAWLSTSLRWRTAFAPSTSNRPRSAAGAARLRRGARLALARPRRARGRPAHPLPRLRGLARGSRRLDLRGERIVAGTVVTLEPQRACRRSGTTATSSPSASPARGVERRDWRSPDVAFDYIHVALPPSKVLDFRAVLHEASARGERRPAGVRPVDSA